LDKRLPASAAGPGGDRAGAVAEREYLADPSRRDAEPLGDLFLCPFGRVHGGQDPLAKILGIGEHGYD
jgi:hypothetical protein